MVHSTTAASVPWTARIDADVVSQNFCAYHAEILFQGRLLCRVSRAGSFVTRDAAAAMLQARLDRWKAEFETREAAEAESADLASIARRALRLYK